MFFQKNILKYIIISIGYLIKTENVLVKNVFTKTYNNISILENVEKPLFKEREKLSFKKLLSL